MVDRAKCIACGAAPAACPEVFELGFDTGKDSVTDKYCLKSIGEIPEELYERAKSGADVCPVNAIKVERVE